MDILLRFALILFLGASLPANASKLPVEAFSSLPDVSGMVLSPDGRYVAFVVRSSQNGVEGSMVRIHDSKNKTSESVIYTDNKKSTIKWLRWANNRHLLISSRFPSFRGTTPTVDSRALIYDRQTKKGIELFPYKYVKKQKYFPQFQDRVIDVLPAEPNYILVQASFESPISSSVYKVNLTNGKRKRIVRDTPRYNSWRTDRTGTLRIGVYYKDAHYKIMHRAVGQNSWESLWEFEALSEDSVWPMGFDGDANILFVRAYHEGREAVFKVDLQDPLLNKTLVHSDNTYDVSGTLIYSLAKQQVVGLSGSAFSNEVYFDAEFSALQGGIDKALSATNNVLLQFSQDERSYLLRTVSDTDPGSYFLGNRDKNSLDIIANRYLRLSAELMSETKSVNYKARDGLEIEAFLTTPKRAEARNLPTIIFPHGGPTSFAGGGFDYWTQYFANKGYAVLQMNFRGSSGYGYDFKSAGFGNWGLEMQQDVEDGTRWLIDQGIADKQRVCVVGASYGGYAALMEARINSELYQCAVSFAGVTDVARLVREHFVFTNYDVVKKQLGASSKTLKDRSPLSGADEIDVPILLVHGKQDRSVKVVHSQKMYKALKRAGKDVSYVEQETGDHYLSNEQNRRELFQEMDQFLDKHLGQAL